jgi:hypothetical protein
MTGRSRRARATRTCSRGGAGGQLAFPGQPLGAAGHLPVRPPLTGIEVPEQDQEPARRRGQMTRQLTDLRLQPLQRHAVLVGGSDGGAGVITRLTIIEHVFDDSSPVRHFGPGCPQDGLPLVVMTGGTVSHMEDGFSGTGLADEVAERKAGQDLVVVGSASVARTPDGA